MLFFFTIYLLRFVQIPFLFMYSDHPESFESLDLNYYAWNRNSGEFRNAGVTTPIPNLRFSRLVSLEQKSELRLRATRMRLAG